MLVRLLNETWSHCYQDWLSLSIPAMCAQAGYALLKGAPQTSAVPTALATRMEILQMVQVGKLSAGKFCADLLGKWPHSAETKANRTGEGRSSEVLGG